VIKWKEWQWPVAFVCLCLGFLIAIQLQTQATLKRSSTPYQRSEVLVELLRQSNREKQDLTDEINSIRKSLGRQTAASEEPDMRAIAIEFKRAQLLAGLTPVTGPGISIALDDSDQPVRSLADADMFVIHDTNLVAVVNELKAAGAEAIEINGQRIVGNTAIRCAGPIILINTKQVAPPFIVEAIGNQNNLMQLDMIGGELDYLRGLGLKVSIDKKDNLDLPAYEGSIVMNFAEPTGGGD